MQAPAEHVNPRVVDRIGVRYIDRITGDAMKDISKLVRPDILGIVATPAAQHAHHTLSESLFTVPEPAAQLLARWGLLPKGGTVDPAAMNAANEESLARMLVVIRHIDRGNAQATRATLMTALDDGVIPFALLAKDEFDTVMAQLGAGPQRSMPVLGPLSAAARAARMPPPPDERVGALQDPVHREVGESRVARTVKSKR